MNQTIINSDHLVFVFKIISYFPLVIIFIGIIGNSASFLIFRFEKELRAMSSMVYLSFCCITDTLSLFTWNLNHFLLPNFDLAMEDFNIHTCRFFQFLQYFTLQSSALLLGFVSIDRYFTVISKPGSFVSKLPFGTTKSAFIISSLITITIGSLNSFMLFTDRLEINQNDTNIVSNKNYKFSLKHDCYILANGYRIFPNYEMIHILIYPIISVIIMVLFNTLLIAKLISIHRKKPQNQKAQKFLNRTINLSVSMLFITFMFIFMCLPAAICYKYFGGFFFSTDELRATIFLMDSLSFLNRSFIFFNCFISNIRFRAFVIRKLKLMLHLTGSSLENQTKAY